MTQIEKIRLGGPLCYILFTNDLPKVILQFNSHVHWSSLTTHCDECGGLCCFADDSTYSVASDNQDILEEKLNQKYKILAEYMANNKLKLNVILSYYYYISPLYLDCSYMKLQCGTSEKYSKITYLSPK